MARVKVQRSQSPKGIVQSRRVTPASLSQAIRRATKAPKFEAWLRARLAEIDATLTMNGHPPDARAGLADDVGPIGKKLTPDHFAASALIIGSEMLEILGRTGSKWIGYGMRRALDFAQALHLAEIVQIEEPLASGLNRSRIMKDAGARGVVAKKGKNAARNAKILAEARRLRQLGKDRATARALIARNPDIRPPLGPKQIDRIIKEIWTSA